MNNPKTCYELFGYECGPGWMGLVEPIVLQVKLWNKKNPDNQVEVLQIKEKWGMLNIYLHNAPEYIRIMVRKAEYESLKICEECGSATDVTTKGPGWIRTLCKDCREAKDDGYLTIDESEF